MAQEGLATMLRVTLLVTILSLVTASDYAGHYTNDFAVEISGGVETARHIAEQYGYEYVNQLNGLGDIYHFRHPSVSHRNKRNAAEHERTLKEHPNVHYVEQQKILGRYKRAAVRDKRVIMHHKQLEQLTLHNRDGIEPVYKRGIEKSVTVEEMGINFNDPQFTRMWYLINRGQTNGPPGYDVNVLPVWKKGITGEGVVVCILDDGVDHTHQDLQQNYDPNASADFNDNRDKNNDPMPEGNLKENSHGTKCAGEIAASANNSVCGVGIAYNAKIGGVRILDGLITDITEANALKFQNDYIHIYSASWGPSDDGKTMEGPGKLAKDALLTGVTQGRQGKGSLFIWATGNGGGHDDDCNCDGYVSSIYTMSIGCISDHGLSTYFSEVCPSTMAVVFTGGSHARPGDEGFVDPPIKVITVNIGGDGDRCTDDFMGTSAAAPLAAGCFALVLEANPELTWRDVQNIVAETAAVPNPDEPGWTINGGGYHINPRFGFGSLDCGKMVEAAQNWNHVPEQRHCEVPKDNDKKSFSAGQTISQTLNTDGCTGDSHIDRLEHVQVHVKLDHNRRGDLNLTLTSPHGTESRILSVRPKDDSNEGIFWTFMTVHNWGENPSGDWTLTVRDVSDPDSGNTGELLEWSMTLWGTKGSNVNANIGKESGANSDTEANVNDDSDSQSREITGSDDAHLADENELKDIMEKEKEGSDTLVIKQQEGTDGLQVHPAHNKAMYEHKEEKKQPEEVKPQLFNADEFYQGLFNTLTDRDVEYEAKKRLIKAMLDEDEEEVKVAKKELVKSDIDGGKFRRRWEELELIQEKKREKDLKKKLEAEKLQRERDLLIRLFEKLLEED